MNYRSVSCPEKTRMPNDSLPKHAMLATIHGACVACGKREPHMLILGTHAQTTSHPWRDRLLRTTWETRSCPSFVCACESRRHRMNESRRRWRRPMWHGCFEYVPMRLWRQVPSVEELFVGRAVSGSNGWQRQVLGEGFHGNRCGSQSGSRGSHTVRGCGLRRV